MPCAHCNKDAATTTPLELPAPPPADTVQAAFAALGPTDVQRSEFAALSPAEQLQALGRKVMLARNCAACHELKPPGDKEPWKVVKADPSAASLILHNVVEALRIASILLKPFIPRSTEAIYTSFNFPKPWADVTYADAAELKAQPEDLRVLAELVDGKPKQLFPRIS